MGAHLEGPFLAPARRGAHPLAHLSEPSPAALEERIGGFFGPAEGTAQGGESGEASSRRHGWNAGGNGPGWPTGTEAADIALVTLAPELEGATAVIQALRRQTLVTCAVAPLREALAVLREARASHRPGRCQLLGYGATTADFFHPLTRHIETCVLENREPYPVERTLLTSGMVIGGVESLAAGETPYATPQMGIAYRAPRESTFWHD